MNPKSNSSFLTLSIIVIALGLLTATARADERGKCLASATVAKKATKKAPVEPTTKRPSKQTVTASAAIADPRQPITVDRKGIVTFHDEMAPIMKAVDLSNVPSEVTLAARDDSPVKFHGVVRGSNHKNQYLVVAGETAVDANERLAEND